MLKWVHDIPSGCYSQRCLPPNQRIDGYVTRSGRKPYVTGLPSLEAGLPSLKVSLQQSPMHRKTMRSCDEAGVCDLRWTAGVGNYSYNWFFKNREMTVR
ncbi:hypothetical protein HHK36_024403 [Tetracentron sinense]|uniref:Uncharacterized protein n=1 Tax=Tetracentron sinense TaxID=13715 RepID=A0A834YKU1_TETSI|nr:hypothetical protein HHK36_024403 [Tetracentron sinense]